MITNLEQLYFNQIRDLYSAETQLLGILPQMAAHATSPELRHTFKNCLDETHSHCARLGTISERHGITHETIACEAMKGLVLETKKHLTETVPGDVRDAVLIASGNRMEHYEIAGYGVAKAFADCLGFDADSKLRSVAKKRAESRHILRRGDDENVAQATKHQRRHRVINHWFVVNRQQLFADNLREWVEPRARAAGEDDCFFVCSHGFKFRHR